MIVDALENWKQYFSGPAWQKAFEFLEGLSPDTAEGEYALEGDKMFARVASYETCGPEQRDYEAHRTYIDIQMALENAECIGWFQKPGLPVKTPYDPKEDVELYDPPGAATAHVDVHPRTIVVLFPQDAHMPQLIVGGAPQTVKKAVVKLALELVDSGTA